MGIKVPVNIVTTGLQTDGNINLNDSALSDGFDNTLSLNGAAPNALLANIDMNSNKITNLAPGVNPTDSVNLQQVVDATGGTVISNIDMGNSYKLINLVPGVNPNDSISKAQFDVGDVTNIAANINMQSSFKLVNLVAGVNPADSITKAQFDVGDVSNIAANIDMGNSFKLVNLVAGVNPADSITKAQFDVGDVTSITANINMQNSYKLVNLVAGVNPADSITKAQFDVGDVSNIAANIDMGNSFKLVNLVAGTAASDSITKAQFDVGDVTSITANINMGNSYKLVNLVAGTAANDSIRKAQLDAVIVGAPQLLYTSNLANASEVTIQRWLDTQFNFIEFNPTGDGVTNDTAKLQLALNAVNTAGGGTLGIPPTASGYFITSVDIPAGVSIRLNPGAKIIHNSTSDLFRFVGDNTGVSGGSIQHNASATGNTFFVLSTANRDKIRVSNVAVDLSPGLLRDSVSTGAVTDFIMENVVSLRQKSSGILTNDFTTGFFIKNCVIDYVGGTPASAQAISVNFSTNCTIQDCRLNGVFTVKTNSGIGGVVSRLNVINCVIENFGSDGFASIFETGTRITGNDILANDGFGINITNSTEFNISGNRIRGANDLTSPTANKHGIQLDGNSVRLSITNNNISRCTGDGIRSASNDIVVTGGVINNNTLRGITTLATSKALITSVRFKNNTVGNYNLNTTADFIDGCQNSANALLSAIQGPATG